ncbi:efflux RND transporter periplasmic adaptor subunit [Lentisphaera profundi]|uniref:Efflux RND transporter periplasmic adaptor subunit n=1 Tax=Lentisphaera profundi TaxID=1658616 RepID=A0ABY7VVV7_9BACT|nr:efflux RND transporter periplasmic adaptor subunit [Lentisphaera profundi]WDE97909.1 efflux RND transporter periplasmic adaptor subunit [Lentisphaera profundi]
MKVKSFVASVIQVLIVVAIIIAAWKYYQYLMDTTPKNSIKPRKERAVRVRLMELKKTTESIVLYTSGKVIPERKLSIKPRITGEIISIHPSLHPGGSILKGEILVEIDPTDFEIAITKARSELREAEFNYQLERGEQDVAKYEWNFLEDRDKISDLEKQLILRIPHLDKAQADIAAAKAQLKQAELNLARTKIRAPYNVQVITRNITEGSQVNLQSSIAELVNSDTFWIEASIAYERLPWIKTKTKDSLGAKASIIPSGVISKGFTWEGRVLRKLPNISENARRARILIDVKAPLEQHDTPLLLNAYVRVTIAGPQIKNIYKIPANIVHEGNKLHLINKEGRLAIKEVQILWSDAQYIYVQEGLEDGDLLVTTRIGSAVPGLKLEAIRNKK